ncbi:MAG TPA: class I SAM-dependent methyltransferase [Bacteroidia bacterium]|nr:class I SAM-dependent methyltransferase [Bacteroidia bacterium]
MAIRNLGAIIVDTLRYNYIKQSFENSGQRKFLLDLGCGVKPFKHMYDKFSTRSVGIDVAQSPHGSEKVDVVYDGKNIPFSDQEFDIVFSTEVMEHVPDPNHFLSEINRVLQPGGILIMTTPFMVSLHEEPYDFYRYTKYGIQHMLMNAGFEVKNITAFGDAFGVILGINIQLFLKVWSIIANVTKIRIIYSEWNPFIFLFVVLPQWLYLGYLKLPLPKGLRKYLAGTPRGYGYVAVKK